MNFPPYLQLNIAIPVIENYFSFVLQVSLKFFAKVENFRFSGTFVFHFSVRFWSKIFDRRLGPFIVIPCEAALTMLC